MCRRVVPIPGKPTLCPSGNSKGPVMYTLQIEHSVNDYAAWKQSFDSDPANRAGSGVIPTASAGLWTIRSAS